MKRNNLKDWFTRGADDRKPSENPMKAIASSLSDWANGIFVRKSWNTEIGAEKALKNPVVFRCVDKIGTAVQSVTWFAEKDADYSGHVSKKEIADVETVLKNPNDQMTGSQLRYWLALNIALMGRVCLKAGVSNGGLNAIYPLQQGKLIADYNIYGNITKYIYGFADKKDTIPSFFSTSKDQNGYPEKGFAFEITKPSLNLLDNTGNDPVKAIVKQVTILDLLADRALDTADETPNIKYILTLPSGITEEEEKKIREQIEDHKVGEEKSGDLMTLYGVDLGIHKLENNLSDLHTKIPADDMARHIAGVFGVPVALMGTAAADSAKFANNYAESRQSFYEDTIIPGYLIPIQEALTRFIAPKGIRIRFDFDSIPALQQSRAKLAKELEGVSFLTRNEKREFTGWEPTDEQAEENAQPNENP